MKTAVRFLYEPWINDNALFMPPTPTVGCDSITFVSHLSIIHPLTPIFIYAAFFLLAGGIAVTLAANILHEKVLKVRGTCAYICECYTGSIIHFDNVASRLTR